MDVVHQTPPAEPGSAGDLGRREDEKGSPPPLHSQENEPDPMCWAKFFTPDGQWTWYAIEFDGTDLGFGYVIGMDAELGYFRLSELMAVRGPFGLPVERDVYFEPCRLSQVKA